MSNETRGIVYRTASGEIASFYTNVVYNCRSVAVEIEPIQNLNGQDAPYPAGGGKNKFNQNAIENRSTTTNSIVNNNGVITVTIGEGSTYNGISTAKSLRSLAPYMVAGNTYTLTVNTTGVAQIYLTDVQWASGQSMVITDELLDKNVWLYANGKGTTATISGIQIDEGSVATAFAPYENICPISGHAQTVVTRTGRNVLDKANVLQNLFISTGAGMIQAIGATGACVYCKIKGGETYTVSKMASARFTIATTSELPAQNVAINSFKANSTATSLTIQTTEADKYIVAFVYLASADAGKTQQEILDTVQVELGSTAHAYEPYTAQTITIPFGSTVYGATLDVTGGVLKVTMASVDMGTLEYVITGGASSPSGYLFRTQTPIAKPRVRFSENNILSPIYHSSANYWFTGDPDNYGMYVNNVGNILFRNDEYGTDTAAFKSAMSGVQLVYELAEPIEIPLTAQQITTLLGNNNIWSDAGDVTVEYPYNDTSKNADFLRLLFIESMWGGEDV